MSEGDAFAHWTVGRMVPMPRHLPNSWRVVQLIKVARLESGHTPSRRRPEYWGCDVPWVSLNDVANLDQPEIATTLEKISKLGLANSSARLLPAGTVIFSRTASVGKATIMSVPMATTQDFANYVCGPEVHNRYLMYLFRYMQNTWKQLMAGSIHNTIYMPVFLSLQVLLPPPLEQQAIANALEDADALIAALEALIGKKRDIKQGAMQELLTGERRLPGFQGDLRETVLGECLVRPPFYGLNAPASVYVDSTPRYLRITDITDKGVLSKTNPASVLHPDATNYLLDDGDIVLARTGASVGKSFLYSRSHGPLVFAGFLICVRPDQKKLVPGYLAAILQSHDYWAWVATVSMRSGQPGINGPQYAAMPLKLPDLKEQRAIAGVLSDMDAEIFALQEKLVKARAVKQGMMQVLLTGEVRLV